MRLGCKAYTFQEDMCIGMDVTELRNSSQDHADSQNKIYVSQEWTPLAKGKKVKRVTVH